MEKAFLELNNYLSSDLKLVKNDNESLLTMGDPMNFLSKGLAGRDPVLFKIIVNYKKNEMDKVFEFSSLDNSKLIELSKCALEMLDQM